MMRTLGRAVYLDGEVYPSVVEAAWGTYFQDVGITALHEPHKLGHYVPDFWLPEFGIYVEIKGGRFTDEDPKKWAQVWKTPYRLLVLNGRPPAAHHLWYDQGLPDTIDQLVSVWTWGMPFELPDDPEAYSHANTQAGHAPSATRTQQEERRKLLQELA